MNTPQNMYKLIHFYLTMSPLYLVKRRYERDGGIMCETEFKNTCNIIILPRLSWCRLIH